jgi:hypothetical protein
MQRVSVFLAISCVSGVLAQVSGTVTTTSLISITPAPSLPVSGVPQALIGYSYVSQLGACELPYLAGSSEGRPARYYFTRNAKQISRYDMGLLAGLDFFDGGGVRSLLYR